MQLFTMKRAQPGKCIYILARLEAYSEVKDEEI
jgi:hypothetical protein